MTVYYAGFDAMGSIGMDAFVLAGAEELYPPNPFKLPQYLKAISFNVVGVGATCDVYLATGSTRTRTITPGQTLQFAQIELAGNQFYLNGNGTIQVVLEFTRSVG